MSEYQRYEFMTSDRPLTRKELDAVNALSSQLTESKAIKTRLAYEKLEQERLAHRRQLQKIHDHQDDYWHQVDMAAVRGSGAGYDEAVELLVKLREAATEFQETPAFQARFRTWV